MYQGSFVERIRGVAPIVSFCTALMFAVFIAPGGPERTPQLQLITIAVGGFCLFFIGLTHFGGAGTTGIRGVLMNTGAYAIVAAALYGFLAVADGKPEFHAPALKALEVGGILIAGSLLLRRIQSNRVGAARGRVQH